MFLLICRTGSKFLPFFCGKKLSNKSTCRWYNDYNNNKMLTLFHLGDDFNFVFYQITARLPHSILNGIVIFHHKIFIEFTNHKKKYFDFLFIQIGWCLVDCEHCFWQKKKRKSANYQLLWNKCVRWTNAICTFVWMNA